MTDLVLRAALSDEVLLRAHNAGREAEGEQMDRSDDLKAAERAYFSGLRDVLVPSLVAALTERLSECVHGVSVEHNCNACSDRALTVRSETHDEEDGFRLIPDPHITRQSAPRASEAEATPKENTMDEIPRRNRLDLSTPAELAIRAAVDAVEAMPAHQLLTEAVILLDQARHKVADFVDLPPAPSTERG